MDFAKFEIMKRRLRAYGNVNAFDMAGLKADLESPGNETFLATFRAELEEALAGGVLTVSDYRALTGEDFEDEDALLANLRAIHAYLFLGGPLP